MNPRFVTKTIHAYLDYSVALTLMVAPFLLGLGSSHPSARWLSVGTGIAAFVLTLLTDHKLGVFRVVPFRVHLAVDAVVGIVFLVAPIVLGFSGLDAWYYFANGVAVVAVVSLHKPEPVSVSPQTAVAAYAVSLRPPSNKAKQGATQMASAFKTTRILLVGVFLGFLTSMSSPLPVLAEADLPSHGGEPDANASPVDRPIVYHRTVQIDGLDISYRDSGPQDAPVVLLLHGFPTSSHMYRNLIPALADRYHVIAPDYPGYGNSSMPTVDDFDYSFDNFADIVDKLTVKLSLEHYSIYLMDYGAPVGFRLAVRHPERVEALIVQNGNAYAEGLREFWKPLKAYWEDRSIENGNALRSLLTLDATKWQYTHGVRDVESISPDNWNIDQRLLDRPGNQEIQLAMFYDYGSNPGRYPKWQQYFREHQPPTLIVWGKNDHIFPSDGAYPYKRDLKTLEFHLLDTGHFALEEDGDLVASLMRDFLARHVGSGTCRVASK